METEKLQFKLIEEYSDAKDGWAKTEQLTRSHSVSGRLFLHTRFTFLIHVVYNSLANTAIMGERLDYYQFTSTEEEETMIDELQHLILFAMLS